MALPPPIVLVHGIFSFGKGGHYPVWDELNPVHFVGHSAGAQVVRMLHQMLADKAFPGHDTSEDWVLRLTSLSGALNGTTQTYYDGMLAEYGRSMKSIGLLQLCRLGVIVYDWLDIPWLKNYYNFGFDHFEMSWRTIQTCYPVAYPFYTQLLLYSYLKAPRTRLTREMRRHDPINRATPADGRHLILRLSCNCRVVLPEIVDPTRDNAQFLKHGME